MGALQRLIFSIGKYLLIVVLLYVAVHECYTGDLAASMDDSRALHALEPTP